MQSQLALEDVRLLRDEIRSLARQLPEDLAALLESGRVTPLAGLTNRVFRFDGPGVGAVVRLPRVETGTRIDREAEAHNALIAERLGLGAPVLYNDPATGIMITRLVPGDHFLSNGTIADDATARVGKAFARLHGSGESFKSNLAPMRIIETLARDAKTEDTADLVLRLTRVAQELASDKIAEVPSHCDPVPGNLLDDGKTIRLIDWEYSAMADPAWDLAYFSLEAGLGREAEGALLDAYAGNGDREAVARRVRRMKPVCDAVSALWALKQAEAGNVATDFSTYFAQRLTRAHDALEALEGMKARK